MNFTTRYRPKRNAYTHTLRDKMEMLIVALFAIALN